MGERRARVTKHIAIVSFTVLLVFSACEYNYQAFGPLGEYIIVADSTEQALLADSLEKYVFPGRHMPIYERPFALRYIDMQQLGQYDTRRNLLLLGSLNGSNDMAVYLRRILSDEARAAIRQGKGYYAWTQDLYAQKQNVLIFTAPDIPALLSGLQQKGAAVADSLWQRYRRDLKASMYANAEQTEVADYLLEFHASAVRVQHDYFVAMNRQADSFYWLRRLNRLQETSRDLFVRYYERGGEIEISPAWMLGERDSLARQFFGRVEIAGESHLRVKDAQVGAWPAIKLETVWRTGNSSIGGPLSMYGFYVPEQDRAYIIDVAVTAVGKRKTDFINQLEIIAETFYIRQ
jgi:hypothetical protein